MLVIMASSDTSSWSLNSDRTVKAISAMLHSTVVYSVDREAAFYLMLPFALLREARILPLNYITVCSSR